MKVYILCYRGTIYGVFSSREKAMASEYGDLYDTAVSMPVPQMMISKVERATIDLALKELKAKVEN